MTMQDGGFTESPVFGSAMPRVLAFETSCDETSAALVEQGRVLANVTRQQLIHSEYGGVVPELASRAHARLILPVTLEALKRSGVDLREVDAVAATRGPGLIGALLVGLVFAKGLAQSLEVPFLGINHLEGHLFSIFITHPEVPPPILFLLVSGGHTELVLMEQRFHYRVLGTTLDDAVGEAFDKGARLLGLPYPGGPHIDRWAKHGDPAFHRFPRARVPGLDFSFSGIKTALRYYLQDKTPEWIQQHLPHLAASYQEALLDMLLEKLQLAVEQTGVRRVAIVGGVSLNSRLRERLAREYSHWEVLLPQPEYCADNAAMIGMVAHERLLKGESHPLDLAAIPDLDLESGPEPYEGTS